MSGLDKAAIEDHGATERRIVAGQPYAPFANPNRFKQSAADAVQVRLGEAYTTQDISTELYREVWTSFGCMRIDSPVLLITRKGGLTHRVVDADGLVHCYAAPETGQSFLKWAVKPGHSPVSF